VETREFSGTGLVLEELEESVPSVLREG